ncbi:MAG: DUF3592 domain-containing protein [Anaerolineaceae bacterium]|nr:DUF3592 domain-containing protein [Anaerolineaceae bacterium]
MFTVKGLKFKHFALIMAAVCIAAGIYLTFFHSAGFVPTKAVIVSITEDPDAFADDSPSYIVTVNYTADGSAYTSRLDSYSPGFKEGKTIDVFYDPNDPSVVHGGSGIGIYSLVVGAALIAFVVITNIKTKQAKENMAHIAASRGGERYAPSVKGAEREVYFLTDVGTAKYGHRIEDKDRKILYEAKMTHFSALTPCSFDFIDHEHSLTTPHMVGQQESSEWNSFLIDSHYTFELDGEDIWSHLKNHGVTVETGNVEGSVWPRYRVSRDGEEIAVIESSSQFVHEEDAEKHTTMNKIAVPGFYRIRTREETLDLVFVTALAFARSGALNDEGGTYGKQFRNWALGEKQR